MLLSRDRSPLSRGAVVAAVAASAATLAAVVAAPTAWAASAASAASVPSALAHAPVPVHRWSAPLTDLQPATVDPLDSGRARLLMVSSHGASTVVLSLSGVGAAATGRTYGAHLHTGPCVSGNGAAAGPHYNDSAVRGVVPPIVGPSTEVWLDVTIGAGGSAVAVAHVPFVPAPGTRSIVLHAQPTDDHGTAGARLACLPVSWS